MVSAYAARLRLTLAPDTVPVAADNGGELEAAIEVLGLIALKGINALHKKVNPYGAGITSGGLTRRMAQADLVAQAVDLDMVEAVWVPTVDNYLNRIPKARIVEAVREAKGEGTAQLLDHLKKGEMAVEAARLLKNTGWLPEVLRRADQVVLDGEDSAEGQLQSEYDHLTSDESIEEGIIANEYTFTESGRRFG
jgi:hypothetical protein